MYGFRLCCVILAYINCGAYVIFKVLPFLFFLTLDSKCIVSDLPVMRVSKEEHRLLVVGGGDSVF